jgi:hypothetical protein
MATTGSPSVLSKHTAFGFGLQTAYGTETAGTVYWLPVNNRITYKKVANRQYPTQADYADSDRLQYSGGQWYEGDIPFSFIPTSAALTALLSWIFDRDSYNQGKVASVYKYWEAGGGHGHEASIDVLVSRATFGFDKGRWNGLTLSLIGRAPGAAAGLTPTMTSRGGPYLWSDTQLTVSYGGEDAAVDLDIDALSIVVDNLVERPEEGLRFNNSVNPLRIDNLGGPRVTGTIGRGFVNTDINDAFDAQVGDPFARDHDGSLSVVCSRESVVVTLAVNGVQWNDPGPDYEGNNDTKIKQDGVPFHALSSLDGATACITYTIA